jgi:hypothetical protein
MNEMLLISYEIPSASKPELAYRFSFPYGAPAEEIFPALDAIAAKLKAEAERIKAELDKKAAEQGVNPEVVSPQPEE